MLKVYPALFHHEDGYWVEFPDLEGCNTCGSSLEETMELAEEALALYLISISERRLPLPVPSSLEDIKHDTNTVATYVSVDMDRYRKNTKAVKKTLSIPAWLAEEAERNNLSLSKVLQEGLRAQLNL